jgi:hypothetical protein
LEFLEKIERNARIPPSSLASINIPIKYIACFGFIVLFFAKIIRKVSLLLEDNANNP